MLVYTGIVDRSKFYFRGTYVYVFNIKIYVTYFNVHFSKNDQANLGKCKLLFIPGSGYMSSLYYSTFVRKFS